jgi:hypothetical protein
LLFVRARLSDYFSKAWKKYVEPPVLLFRPEKKCRQQVPTTLHGVTCHKAEFLIGEIFFPPQHVCGNGGIYSSRIAIYLLILVWSLFNYSTSRRFMEVDLSVSGCALCDLSVGPKEMLENSLYTGGREE